MNGLIGNGGRFVVGKRGAAEMPTTDRFGTPLYSPARIAMIKAAIEDPTTVNHAAYNAQLKNISWTRTPNPYTPWGLPDVYDEDPSQASQSGTIRGYLQNDSNHALMCAIMYQLTGDEKYALNAAQHIAAWNGISYTQIGAALLSWNTHYGAMVTAAHMIEDSAHFTQSIKDGLTAAVNYTLGYYNAAHRNENNWAGWGLTYELSCAVWLRDRARFDKAIARWKYLMEYSVDKDGILFHEVHRQGAGQGDGSSGLWYSEFHLLPMTIAAEIARTNGVWLYDHVSPSGHTLKRVWEHVSKWRHQPATFIYNTSGTVTVPFPVLNAHIEILHNIWPNEHSTALLAAHRPVEFRHTAVVPSVTHANLPLVG